MIWDDATDEYVLTTGRRLSANCGILGVAALDGSVSIWEGGDCTLSTRGMTAEERAEIAAYAIALWEDFAAT